MKFVFNEENRVNVNLSDYAWNIIHEDMAIFYSEKQTIVSGFINDIFSNYYKEAQASIQSRCDELYSYYENMISEENLKEPVDSSLSFSIPQAMTDSYRKKIMDEINEYPNGEPTKVKLRNDVAEILKDSTEAESYKGVAGAYIKAIMEEYARLPFLKRETIFCQENHKLIEEAIRTSKQLKITTRSGKEFHANPYRIMTDKLGLFNYLVALDADSKLPVSYRISMVTIKVTAKSGKITKEQEKEIKKKLKESDVSFLSKDNKKFIIRLNKYGIQKYNSQLHMRPKYSEILPDNRYVFNCSKDQIKFYFVKFGSSAIIEEPVELALWFRDVFAWAEKAYNDFHNFDEFDPTPKAKN